MDEIEAFRKKLINQNINGDNLQSKYIIDKTNKSNKIPKADILAVELAAEYRQLWIYCQAYKSWVIYEPELPGIWKLVSKNYIEHKIHKILIARGISGYGSNSYIENIRRRMKKELTLHSWIEFDTTDLLPFKNGVLDLVTGKFHNHSPDFWLTWQLPRDYNLNDTDWSHISKWLDQATRGRIQDKKLLLCFTAAVVRRRFDLRKFLHLIGDGIGKSTFNNLLITLLGENNVANLDIEYLNDHHETVRAFSKRLIIMGDQDKVEKRLSNFKSLIEGDPLSGRRIFESSFEFIFDGLVVITSQTQIFPSNLRNWLSLRRLMVSFDYQCPTYKQRNLIREFMPELSAFTNYLLSIPIKDIENTFKGLGNLSSLSKIAWDSLIRSDSLAAWLNTDLIYNLDCLTPIGSNSHEWIDREEYNPSSSSLYGSYSLYCRETNLRAKSIQNFSSELIELCRSILGWDIKKARVKIAGKSVRVIKGLKLRNPQDNDPTIENIFELHNQRH
ncbi:MAG: DUF5906 domain-containing protein [Prochloraceae cyanobacterium]